MVRLHYYMVIILLLAFLSSCSPSSKLEGEWIRTDFNSTLSIKGKKITFDNITEREFVIKDSTLKVVAFGIADDYTFKFSGDTLLLKKGGQRQQFIPKSKLPSEKELIREQVKAEAQDNFKRKIKQIELQKTHWGEIKKQTHLPIKGSIADNEWVYVAKVIFEDDTYPDAALIIRLGQTKIGTIKPVWKETLESSARRFAVRSLGIPAKEVRLEDKKTQVYEGVIITDNDVELPIFLDSQKGIIPKQDAKAISAYYTHYLKSLYGKQLIEKMEINPQKQEGKRHLGTLFLTNGSQIELEYYQDLGIKLLNTKEADAKLLIQGIISSEFKTPVTVEEYTKEEEFSRVTLSTSHNEKMHAKANVNGRWMPENTVEDITVALKYKIQQDLDLQGKVTSIKLNPYGNNPNFYMGVVAFSKGMPRNVGVKYLPTGIDWSFLE